MCTCTVCIVVQVYMCTCTVCIVVQVCRCTCTVCTGVQLYSCTVGIVVQLYSCTCTVSIVVQVYSAHPKADSAIAISVKQSKHLVDEQLGIPTSRVVFSLTLEKIFWKIGIGMISPNPNGAKVMTFPYDQMLPSNDLKTYRNKPAFQFNI